MPRSPKRLGYILTALIGGIVALVIIIWAATAVATIAQPPTDPFISRIYYQDRRDIEELTAYDLLEYNNEDEQYILAIINSHDFSELQKAGWRIEIDASNTANFKDQAHNQAFFNGYRTVDELYAELQLINSTAPTLTELVNYGQSYCQTQGGCTTLGGDAQPGYDLFALRISNETISGTSTISNSNVISGSKPIFFLLANIHAREISTPELAMRLIDWLVDGYGTDPDATWLVDWHEIWVVPTANPDGHWLVELGTQPPYNSSPLSQRKNANNDANEDEVLDCSIWLPYGDGYGVDLNRNHSFKWQLVGASNDPCHGLYHGPSAASESEVSQLQTLIAALLPDQRGPNLSDAAPDNATGIFISLHSYSRLVLWPWAYRYEEAPNGPDLQAIGTRLATFNGYTPKQGSALYIASGTSDDWVYGELGAAAFTFEIGNQFFAPYSDIDAVQWPNNGPAFKYAAKIARTPYQTVHGPELHQPTFSVASPTTLMVTAVANDTLNGNQTISQAELYVGNPPWNGGVPQPMLANDGAFDTAVETVSAEVDISGLSNGRYLLYHRGQDNAGNWGPFTAQFIDIPLPLDTIGPTASNLQITPAGQYSETITADLSDSNNGNAYIHQAEVYIDQLPGNGGIAQPLLALDGAYNQPAEAVSGTLNTNGLSEGQHTIYVRGQDIWGNWGPFSQQTLTIDLHTACGLAAGVPYIIGTTAAVTITVNQLGTLNCLTLTPHPQLHTQATANIGPDRYWTMSGTNSSGSQPASGFVLTLTLPFSGTPDAADGVCRFAGGGPFWSCGLTAFDDIQETVTLAGITQLGDWAVGENLDVGATAVTPNISAIINDGIQLAWSDHTAANCHYEIHSSATPYFTPAGLNSWQADITDFSSMPITHTIAAITGNPAQNHTYLVRAFNCTATPYLVTDAPYLGEFDFALQPGS